MMNFELELNVIERLEITKLFSQFNVRTIERLEDQKQILDILRLTEEEKKTIEWIEIEGPTPQVTFDQIKASRLHIKFGFSNWQSEVLKTALVYSELLDDFSPAFLRIHRMLFPFKVNGKI